MIPSTCGIVRVDNCRKWKLLSRSLCIILNIAILFWVHFHGHKSLSGIYISIFSRIFFYSAFSHCGHYIDSTVLKPYWFSRNVLESKFISSVSWEIDFKVRSNNFPREIFLYCYFYIKNYNNVSLYAISHNRLR